MWAAERYWYGPMYSRVNSDVPTRLVVTGTNTNRASQWFGSANDFINGHKKRPLPRGNGLKVAGLA